MSISTEFKIFISYTHDSESHKKWVTDLATLLGREGFSVDVDTLKVEFGDDIDIFMQGIRVADKVLYICTPRYVKAFNERIGGAGFEAMLAVSRIKQNPTGKADVPILREGQTVPFVLESKLRADFRGSNIPEEEMRKFMQSMHKAKKDTILDRIRASIVIPPYSEALAEIEKVVNLSFNACLYKEVKYSEKDGILRLIARPILGKQFCQDYLTTGWKLEKLFAVEPFRLFYKIPYITLIELQIQSIEDSERYQKGIYSISISKSMASEILGEEIDILREFQPDGELDIDYNWRNKIIPAIDYKSAIRNFFNQRVNFQQHDWGKQRAPLASRGE